jgi:hypothetical protein
MKPLWPKLKDVKAPGITLIIAILNITSIEDRDAVTPSTLLTLALVYPIAV